MWRLPTRKRISNWEPDAEEECTDQGVSGIVVHDNRQPSYVCNSLQNSKSSGLSNSRFQDFDRSLNGCPPSSKRFTLESFLQSLPYIQLTSNICLALTDKNHDVNKQLKFLNADSVENLLEQIIEDLSKTADLDKELECSSCSLPHNGLDHIQNNRLASQTHLLEQKQPGSIIKTSSFVSSSKSANKHGNSSVSSLHGPISIEAHTTINSHINSKTSEVMPNTLSGVQQFVVGRSGTSDFFHLQQQQQIITHQSQTSHPSMIQSSHNSSMWAAVAQASKTLPQKQSILSRYDSNVICQSAQVQAPCQTILSNHALSNKRSQSGYHGSFSMSDQSQQIKMGKFDCFGTPEQDTNPPENRRKEQDEESLDNASVVHGDYHLNYPQEQNANHLLQLPSNWKPKCDDNLEEPIDLSMNKKGPCTQSPVLTQQQRQPPVHMVPPAIPQPIPPPLPQPAFPPAPQPPVNPAPQPPVNPAPQPPVIPALQPPIALPLPINPQPQPILLPQFNGALVAPPPPNQGQPLGPPPPPPPPLGAGAGLGAPFHRHYNLDQRVQMALAMHRHNGVRQLALQDFRLKFPGIRDPALSTFTYEYKKLLEKGTLKNTHKDALHPSPVVTQAVVAAVYFNALRQSTFPSDVKRDSLQYNTLGLRRTSAAKAFKLAGLMPYKIKDLPLLKNPLDFTARLIFANWFLAQPIGFEQTFLFSDEFYIDLNFSVNKQNQREWFPKNTGGNPNFCQYHQVPRDRVMIWIGVLGDGRKCPIKIFPPLFRMHGHHYHRLLQDQVQHLAQYPDFNQIWWQQDGAPVHSTRVCKTYLSQIFGPRVCGNGQSSFPWNGVDWPPRSPDLSVMDYSLINNLREKIKAHPAPTSFPALIARAYMAWFSLTPAEITSAYRGLRPRLQRVIANQGGHIGG